ncbi:MULTISPECIES: hypothetical protein [unclassified Enterococcus]|uniref:hypothetical protein n=1 Tax=unclassified Enterococcus TaxID=2608891 RepID=UPI0028FDB1D6|nr:MULTISPECIES: hypothetical protein [unclassified Enterococcus]MDU0320695.1 hypothetical protein [Enterococcus sp. 2STP]MDU0335337.1 hypothetical protein [Enterococcus sp. 2CBP]MDU0350402.1 hypothetical protein [Enterococcus sp. 3MOLP]
MADIKGLDIFGNNKGLAKIKKEAEAKKKQQTITPSENKQSEVSQLQEMKASSNIERQGRRRAKKVGAPIRKFDKVYSTKHPLKLSTLLNATSRVLVEKYETNMTRDELLRKALDEYIRQNLTQEDKQDLFNDVVKELNLFREKYPIVPELDDHGEIVRTTAQIKKDTEESIRKGWGMNLKSRVL